ncbi:DUF3299 domain-containing protein [Salinisphaera sp. T31B1]|uniref:DUF3299 domain-containing protein n=1 Tax=Salinisphaera sp. T31B1 TaxID=727963 RepID=UPI00333F9E47
MKRAARRLAGALGLALLMGTQTVLADTPASIELIYEQLAPTDGAPVIPAIQNDVVYLAAEVRDADGDLLDGVPITLRSINNNRRVGPTPFTRDGGYTDITLVARSLGRDTLTITAGPVSTKIDLDVRAAATVDEYAATLDGTDAIDGILGWATLMQANLDYDETFRVSATYPPALRAHFGDTVRLAGYMLPIQMSAEQTRFILSANPPVCFFHLPGGPATVVDVHSVQATEMTWEPIVVEGRLAGETQSDDGLLYRLTDARVIRR